VPNFTRVSRIGRTVHDAVRCAEWCGRVRGMRRVAVDSPVTVTPTQAALLLTVPLMLLAVGCGDDDAATEAEPDSDCIVVTSDTLEDALSGELFAVRSEDEFSNGSTAWYVSSSTGGTWATSTDPTDPSVEDSGLILPLDDEARVASDSGVDVPADAPIYGSTSIDSGDALASQACADAG
jgi:hypothetical protein